MASRGVHGTNPKISLEVKKEFRIKKEASDEDIKEYAETAMNEFLGWYGYDKVDSSDTQGLNLHHFASRKRGRRSPIEDDSSDAEGARSCSPSLRDRGSPTPESSVGASNGFVTCCWCSKAATHKSFSLKTPGGHKYFCSELCFTQCRRANFKRNKTCDWCRHIRHTVSYVDFQDGEHQLQFCSDKCLNQYKMNIFCKETEAHLQLHPHLAETGNGKGPGSSGLITPDLWLRDCRSESPTSGPSPSPPVPPAIEITKVERKEQPIREKNKIPKSKRSKNDRREGSSRQGESRSSPKPSHTYPPPLLPLSGHHVNLMPPNMPPDHHLARPPFLNFGYFPHPPMFTPDPSIHRNGPRFPGLANPHMISSPTPPPVINPPPPRPVHPLPKSLLPPITILVPCPIPLPIPLPIPIPIPIPIANILATETKLTKDEKEKTDVSDVKDPEEEKQDDRNAEPVVNDPPKNNIETNSRPLRKRKRISDIPQENDGATKRKTVPV